MFHRTNRRPSWPILPILCVVAWSAQACNGGRDVTIIKATGGSSAGGRTLVAGTGSETGGSGTAPSIGGAGSGSGGSSTGDAGAADAGAGGSATMLGSAGAGSGLRCTSDKQCQALGQLCDMAHQRCVECISKDQCEEGGLCIAHQCKAGSPCASDTECVGAPYGLAVCDVSRGECVQCLETPDCGQNADCIDRHCVSYVPCQDSRGCSTGIQVCNLEAGRCVDCNTDADCLDQALPTCAADGTCHAACSATDDACSALGQVCDRMEGYCVECRYDGDCRASQHCRSAACVPDLCNPGESRCDGNEMAECSDTGNAFGPPIPCEPGQICVAALSHASCVTPGQGQGGAGGVGGAAESGGVEPEAGKSGAGGVEPYGGSAGSVASGGTGGSTGGAAGNPASGAGGFDDSGGAGGQGGSGPCATRVAPCTTIAAFAGAQNVDGYDDEFCDVPSFLLDFGSHNAKVNTYRTSSPSEEALARIAWSSDALHVFVTVTDSLVRAWTKDDKIYEGDSVELMLASTTSVSGDPGDDSGTIQIQASYQRGFVVRVQDGGEASRTPLAEGQLAGRVFVGGYTVELEVPWPGTAPHSGSTIRLDLTLNSAQNTTEATWRDAQAILAMGGSLADSPCGSDVQPYCDDRTWCPTELE